MTLSLLADQHANTLEPGQESPKPTNTSRETIALFPHVDCVKYAQNLDLNRLAGLPR